MNESQPPKTIPEGNIAGASTPPASMPPTKRRRWLWLFAVFVILLLALVLALPYFVAAPPVRDWVLRQLSTRANLQINAKELSLGWFSPIVAGDITVQNDVAQQAMLGVNRIEGDTALWRLLFSHDAGKFRIIEPQLNIEFDKGGWNLARLLQLMAHMAVFNSRTVQWELIDCRFSLRGPSSTKPLVIDKLNLQGTTIPASQSPLGVPILRGGPLRLMNQTELTPELGNDLLKFIAPVLSQTTSASGRVSLELGDFSWPLGKPEKAEVKGKLTLHSVEVGPGQLVKLLTELVEFKNLPATLQIAKEDVVPFTLHDGRVYHENLAFSLSATEGGPMVRSHGSVGLDETLDLFLDFSVLGSSLPAESTVQSLLGQVTLHLVGTLSSPKLAAPALKAISDWLQQRRSEKSGESPRPGLLPGRRNANEKAQPAPP